MFSSRSQHWRIGGFGLGFLLVVLALFSEETKRVDAFVPQTHSTVGIVRTAALAKKRTSSNSLGLAIAETCEPIVSLAKAASEGYAISLVENPLPTKSLTAGFLCGISDILAQKRSLNFYDPRRTLRFASKGCVGGIVWMFWYDWVDEFLTYNGDAFEETSLSAPGISFYALLATILPPDSYQTCIDHNGFVKTFCSMVLEQLVWCPLVYGFFEIPVSTLLNGGSLRKIPKEVNRNLNGLLVDNFKVWTPANLFIYNAPLEWRPVLGNVIDVFWQSIVSDVAADCGKNNSEDECLLNENYAVERTMINMAAQTYNTTGSKVEQESGKTILPEPLPLYAEESGIR